jgi:hypothetical protein
MVDIKPLLTELKKLVVELAEDLLTRSTENAKIDAGLRDAFHQIERGGRTAQVYEVWRDDYLDQVAVAWVLACVFVRFMEDNHLIDECWLAGDGDRRRLADDTHELFFREHPHDTDREYFHHVFKEVGKIPAAKDLFAEGKTPLWAVAPSGDAAMTLLKFWREIDAEAGHLKRSFQVENGDTRFLGDLYQELSERAKKKFALLQTPVFVEEFILDRTLTPAIDEFGLEKVRMIDPTCGSGHFLLGGFARLFDLWGQRESNEIKAAQKALDGVWGVDINPFAVAIARFRLTVAAVQACAIKTLNNAPAWMIHLATGDSWLLGSRWDREGKKRSEFRYLDDSWAPEIYACEDKEAAEDVLGQQYHAVVGNPPYIIVRDQTLNAAYRDRFTTCAGKYSLAVPFAERFFDLCTTTGSRRSGYVGMITTNSFMKREFGKKLIQDFFPQIDLTHVIDTSGAYIPGHGTPTVVLFGRNRKPNSDCVRAVLGIKGEPATPKDASNGYVWQSIVKQIDRAGVENEFVSTADVPRTTFSSHPWSIGGGGAAELKESIEDGFGTLSNHVLSIGFMAIMSEDDVYMIPTSTLKRLGLPMRHFIRGENIRDWSEESNEAILLVYDNKLVEFSGDAEPSLQRYLWPYRTRLSARRMFGKGPSEHGREWYSYMQFIRERVAARSGICYATVSTHNQFWAFNGDAVCNQHAPIILFQDPSAEVTLGILGALNSSVSCFWMKQVFHNKGSSVDQHGARQRTAPFEDFYEYTGTGLQRFPLPDVMPVDLSRQLERSGKHIKAVLPEALVSRLTPEAHTLLESRQEAEHIRAKMVALQEELDWQCYQLYGLLSEDLRYTGDDTPEVALGQRSFEIVMARQMAKGELETTWFVRHGSTPVTEIPTQWPAAYRKVVERRTNVIETNKEIALIEKPEYKRRWNDEPWQEQEQRALNNWLLDRLETPKYRKGKKDNPELTTTSQMGDVACADAEFLQVAALYRGRPDFNVAALVAELVEGEAVPFLPILRYKQTGLRKREIWERTWELQKEEDRDQTTKHTKHTKEDKGKIEDSDSIRSDEFFSVFRVFRGSKSDDDSTSEGGSKSVGGSIPVPPKYTIADFLKTDFWRLRGKLDVPKERWISYPHCSTDSDPTLVVGWAGWNHLEQATALVAYYDARKREGWDAKRLAPLLAALDQLLPWIHQWHPETDPEFGETAGRSFQTMLEHDAHELGLTLEDIRKWEPPTTARKGRPTRKKKASAEDDE